MWQDTFILLTQTAPLPPMGLSACIHNRRGGMTREGPGGSSPPSHRRRRVHTEAAAEKWTTEFEQAREKRPS